MKPHRRRGVVRAWRTPCPGAAVAGCSRDSGTGTIRTSGQQSGKAETSLDTVELVVVHQVNETMVVDRSMWIFARVTGQAVWRMDPAVVALTRPPDAPPTTTTATNRSMGRSALTLPTTSPPRSGVRR